MTLTEFLAARLDEDEVVASASQDDERRHGSEPGSRTSHLWLVNATGQVGVVADGARVLAEVEAKRRIVELADEATGLDMSVDLDRRVGPRDQAAEPYIGDQILRTLALPYADHPEFCDEWRI